MKLLLLVFVISSTAALETYTETRDITDSAGNTFSSLSLSFPPLRHWRRTRKPETSQTPQATPSPPCLCHFLHCGTGDVHGNQRHHRLRRQHLLLLVFVISSTAALETYTETRDITDS